MQDSFINIGLAFIEGLALIVSPCILPLLPVFLAGSIEGDRKRPIGVIIGFILAFALFTFFAKKIVDISGIDLTLVRNISFSLLILLAVIMMSSYLTERFSMLMQRIASLAPETLIANDKSANSFIGGLIFGSLLGLIWTPCAGPILSAVILQTVIQKTTLSSFLTILAFGIGVCVPMLLIVFLGRKFIATFSSLKQKAILLRKILGIIIILSVVLMIYADTLTLTFSQTPKDADVNIKNNSQNSLINGLAQPYPAPPIEDITAWINSDPLQISDLKGKVVLIDFWAYSCINCIRTLPYLKSWYQKYHDQGLIIIGIHSPEFDFERNSDNVKAAVQKFGILYPVALDNNFITWRNYHNQYWPASYLINKNSEVVYEHFGEGNYDVTENNIRYLLGLNASKAPTEQENLRNFTPLTPETYLGYERADAFLSPERSLLNSDKAVVYSYPLSLPANAWALNGNWTISAQKIVSNGTNESIRINFNAQKVFAVMSSQSGKPINVKISLDGKPVSVDKGEDVKDSMVTVQQARLYHLINLNQATQGILELTASDPGHEIYTFTFGQ